MPVCHEETDFALACSHNLLRLAKCNKAIHVPEKSVSNVI
jgi:hypothetical protein